MNKKVSVRIAGKDEDIRDVQINPNTTAAELLALAGCPSEYEISPGVGMPPFGKDERVYDRLRDNGKAIASPPADAGE